MILIFAPAQALLFDENETIPENCRIGVRGRVVVPFAVRPRAGAS
jgi:hypothetical protein